MITRKPIARRWDKDGRWHISERYEPTLADRSQFPTSYPADDPGPFFIWSVKSFTTEKEALAALHK